MCRIKKKENQKLLVFLNKFMDIYYNDIRLLVKETEPQNKLSDTLITKILMGTLGCVPAYDRYFIAGVKSQNVTTRNYNMGSVLKLVDFYERNKGHFEQARKQLSVYELPYPQMKMLDMGFWQIGFDLDTNKELKNAH